MDQKEKDIQLIESFLRGELSEEASTDFKTRLLSDTAFSKLYEELKLISQAARSNQLRDKLDQLKSLEAALSKSENEISDADLDVINARLQNRLNQQEEAAFKAILENPGFKKNYQQILLLQSGIIQNRKKELLSDIRQWEMDAPPLSLSVGQKTMRIGNVMPWAAIVLFLLAAGLWFWTKDSPSDNEQLFAEYFQPYPATQITRSGEPSTDSLTTLSFTLYGAGNYSAAIPLFEQLSDQSDTLARFYLANALLANKESELAIPLFDRMRGSEYPQAIPSAWFLGLAYLEAEKTEEAKIVFEELSKGNSSYADKAKKVLDQLNKK